ncbi:DUF937 domain-containing protein [Deinococcus aestuarii]|uniref:DUF937 domain-containing protein n=1 Tax=Deinococcus aestuarii TaxID=2774531 RepID=UPI001C0BCE25|nr:DUF937 domain-containing protein [Deinococcus aestuarii]
MMDIFNMLGGMGQAQQTVGNRLGTSPNQTQAALEAAVPLLLGAMTRNAQQPGGAQALSGALDQHDGSALDLFGQGQAPDPYQGQNILGHVFGNQQQAAANAVSRRAGIDPQLAMQVLAMAAPLVLGYLSRQRQGQGGGFGQMGGGQMGGAGGFDIGSILGGMLGGGMGGGLGGMLGGGQGQTPTQGGVLGGGSVIPGYSQDPYGQSGYAQDPRQTQGEVLGGPMISDYTRDPSGQTGYDQNPLGQPGHVGTGQMGGGAGNMGGMIGTLNNVLDRDGDGNALDDLIGMFGGGRR